VTEVQAAELIKLLSNIDTSLSAIQVDLFMIGLVGLFMLVFKNMSK
jgi:hypothetical protein